MRSTVFGPLGLTATVADINDSLIDARARFYERMRDGRTVNAPYVDNSGKWAAGGFLSTTDDLSRFGAAMSHPGFLSAPTLALLQTSQHTRDGRATGYGMGWFVGTDAAGRRMIWHGGTSMGGTAYLLLYPDQHLAVAVACNSDDPFVAIARRVALLFLADNGA
jgi:CubicO group peptidase (beta-lactamase class C family)